MNLKRISDNSSTFKVGNLNDYLNIINKVNTLENCDVDPIDFVPLETEFPNQTLSYKISSSEDPEAVFTLDVNGIKKINIYR